MTLVLNNEQYSLRKRFRQEEELDPSKYKKKNLIVDVNDGTILTRTPLNWLSIIVFYLFFFAALAIIWTICYIVFQTTIKDSHPSSSIIQPGFSYEPSTAHERYGIIKYSYHEESDVLPFIKKIRNLFEKYSTTADEDDTYKGCKNAEDYGYYDNEPCVFLKLNRVIGFKAETYKEITDFPSIVPEQLKKGIKGLKNRENKIWISCSTSEDVNIQFIPTFYFDANSTYVEKKIVYTDFDAEDVHKFYSKEDLKRIVAIKFHDVPYNTKIKVQCYIWAKNINQDMDNGRGALQFFLQINSEEEAHKGDGTEDKDFGSGDESTTETTRSNEITTTEATTTAPEEKPIDENAIEAATTEPEEK